MFLVDNAYMGGALSWNWFDAEIKSKVSVFEGMIKRSGYGRYRTAKNWAVHEYMTDTLVKGNGLQRYQYHYDKFDNDTVGTVYNLLQTYLGNCRSLPYLFKIWCEEIGADAFLSTAPMHVFAKQQDETGVWWNIELTSFYRYMPTEDYISQFEITEPAVQSGLYLKTLNNEEILCLCLDDLLRYYIERTNITCDNFLKEVIETTIKYHPVSEVRLKQFSCLKYDLDKAMEKKRINDYEQIGKDSTLKRKYAEMDKIGRYIKGMGYHKVSEERYQQMRNETAEKAKFYSKR